MKELQQEQIEVSNVLSSHVFDSDVSFNSLYCDLSGEFILFLSEFPRFCTWSYDELWYLAKKMVQKAKIVHRFLPDPDS